MRPGLRFLALLAALVLAGCGGPEAPEAPSPRTVVRIVDPGPVGSWVLVKDQPFVRGMRRAMAERTGSLPAEARVAVDEAIANMALRVTFHADATFELSGELGRSFTAAGTWTIQDREMTLTTTRVDGGPPAKASVARGTYDRDTIRFASEGEWPLSEMLLRRE